MGSTTGGGSPEPEGPAATATVTGCQNYDVFEGAMAAHGFGGPFGWQPETTSAPVAWQSCTRIADGETVGWVTGRDRPAAPPDTGLLVASAQAQLELDLPEVATSPPRGGVQLVGIPVWFWLTNREPVSTTASIPNLSATLTATPATTHIEIRDTDPTDGADDTTLDCPDGGRPWQRGRDDPRADGPCSHTFGNDGTSTIDVTVTWSLAWTATNGQNGTLPTIDRTTTFTLTIQEAQATTD